MKSYPQPKRRFWQKPDGRGKPRSNEAGSNLPAFATSFLVKNGFAS
jgi:hypothetical protein